ncbi:MAG TPA: galactose-1-epimerase [Marinilabiliales bacterium]|nr:MAG: galactose mutarotase [Bacteroidetes bacterium GWA2_40_14]OFX73046.1 MAG: galactose mutarotase [Bacteroidetes bacterium GWD2_40_43]OFX91524.1 MAG: galactose mutarotase [Bacteroidetes bacterium GWE2_40_63]OFY19686.1 MAG: galactose mutarotase [Bacteroidetes bacterium GWF2_40_13]OFZ25472.1 MAG: galactose mutarotase [Bacteroidetes bacterium RIFOXYC2_FULL_40_12]HAN00394.1 galactose-1-epimerase [Marinilabiliales bacterium]
MKKFKFNLLLIAACALFALSCSHQKPSVFTEVAQQINVADFTQTIDGKPVSLYTLQGKNGIGMKVTNFGARVVSLCVPDVNHQLVDVVLGYKTLNEYVNYPENFLGAAIGRYGNRIGGATFTLDSTDYELVKNEGNNQLHGGPKGFFDVVWDANQLSNSKVVFTYLSKEGEEGFPGNLSVEMTYELTDDQAFKISYKATTDKTTICNLTHHSYFNLSGEGAETINDHVLQIKADGITPVDSVLIPTGELMPVAGTPFDFNTPIAIGERVSNTHGQLALGHGYDHNWVLNREGEGAVLVASVYSPVTKINMDIITDQPGLQFYGGNFIDGTLTGKSGKPYFYRSAFCLETQHYPDSPNKPEFPSVVLKPGETYNHVCLYKFSVK